MDINAKSPIPPAGAEIGPSEAKCIRLAQAFIKANSLKFSIRNWMGSETESAIASDVLMGNIAYDRYKTCMAMEGIPVEVSTSPTAPKKTQPQNAKQR